MCARLWLVVFCLVTAVRAQTSVDYRQENDAYERELQQQPVQTKIELQLHQQQQQQQQDQERLAALEDQEKLRLAALEAELQEELKLSQYANMEGDGPGAIPGVADRDYPVFTTVPRTSFSCAGRPPGYHADVQARCQVFHICDAAGAKHSFLCPRGSLFSQKYLVCDWWYTSECDPSGQSAFQDFNRLDSERTDPAGHQDFSNFSDAEENYILLQPDIFRGAETGVPRRDKFESSSANGNERRTNGGGKIEGEV